MRPAAVPVLVFAGLVVATFAAFFVTTRLKRAAPVVEQLTFRRSFSPNGDGRFDVGAVRVPPAPLRRRDGVDRDARRRRGAHARRGRLLERGRRHRFRWDGRNDAGPGRARRRVPPARRPAQPGPHRHVVAQAVPRHRAAADWSCATCRRTRSRPTARAARTRATLRFTGPLAARAAARLPHRPARARAWSRRRDIPRGESTRALGRARDRRRRGADGRLPDGRARAGRGRQRRAAARAAAARRGARPPGLAVTLRRGARPRCRARRGTSRGSTVAADGRRYRWSVRRLGAAPPVGARRRGGLAALVVRAPRGRSGVALLDGAGRRAPVHDAVRGAGRSGSSGCWSCCPRPPGRRATGSSTTATATRTCCRRERRVSVRRAVRGRRPAARASPADESALLGSSTASGCATTSRPTSRSPSPEAPPIDRYTRRAVRRRPRFAPAARAGAAARRTCAAAGRVAWIGRARLPVERRRRRDGRGAASELAARGALAPDAVRRAGAPRAPRPRRSRCSRDRIAVLRRACRRLRPVRPARGVARACRAARGCWPRPARAPTAPAVVVYRQRRGRRRAHRRRRLRPRAAAPRPPPSG